MMAGQVVAWPGVGCLKSYPGGKEIGYSPLTKTPDFNPTEHAFH